MRRHQSDGLRVVRVAEPGEIDIARVVVGQDDAAGFDIGQDKGVKRAAISPVPRAPAMLAVLYWGSVAPARVARPGNRSRPDARRERTPMNRRRIRAPMSGCPRPSNRYRL